MSTPHDIPRLKQCILIDIGLYALFRRGFLMTEKSGVRIVRGFSRSSASLGASTVASSRKLACRLQLGRETDRCFPASLAGSALIDSIRLFFQVGCIPIGLSGSPVVLVRKAVWRSSIRPFQIGKRLLQRELTRRSPTKPFWTSVLTFPSSRPWPSPICRSRESHLVGQRTDLFFFVKVLEIGESVEAGIATNRPRAFMSARLVGNELLGVAFRRNFPAGIGISFRPFLFRGKGAPRRRKWARAQLQPERFSWLPFAMIRSRSSRSSPASVTRRNPTGDPDRLQHREVRALKLVLAGALHFADQIDRPEILSPPPRRPAG